MLEPIKCALLEGCGTVGIVGEAGLGKTVLASIVARDCELAAAFPAGVFWLTVGQSPNSVPLQLQLDEAFGGTPADADHLLPGRRFLLVLDDVLTVSDATMLRKYGQTGQLLVITRNREVLHAGFGVEPLELKPLTLEQSLELLGGCAGQTSLPQAAAEVAKLYGHLPLALSMIGALIRVDTANWSDVSKWLASSGMAASSEHQHLSLQSIMEVCVRALSAEEANACSAAADCYRALAVFPVNYPIPFAAVHVWWSHRGLRDNEIRDLLSCLENRALLSFDGADRIRLHTSQSEYLRNDASNLAELHSELVAAYRIRNRDLNAADTNDGYFFQQFTHHLKHANRQDHLETLLTDFTWLQAKVRTLGTAAVISDFDLLSEPRGDLRHLADAIRLSADVVDRDAEQLASQLTARLLRLSETSPALRSLLQQISVRQVRRWLRPVTPCLTPPGGPLLRTLAGHSLWVNDIAVTPDGTQIISASADQTLKVWDLNSGAEVHTLAGHRDYVREVVVTPDGYRIVSASLDGEFKIWDLATGAELRSIAIGACRRRSISITSDGRRVICAWPNKSLTVWDLESGAKLHTLLGHTASLNIICVTPDGRWAIAASDNETIGVWDLTTGEQAYEHWLGDDESVRALALTPDSQRMVTTTLDETLSFWDLESGDARYGFSLDDVVDVLRVMPDGRRVICGSSNGCMDVRDLETGNRLLSLAGHTEHSNQVRAVTVAPNGRYVISAAGNEVKVWDLEADNRTLQQGGYPSAVGAVSVTPDGKRAISASATKIAVWDLVNGIEVRALIGQTEAVQRQSHDVLAIESNGRHAISASGRDLKLWDLESGAEIRTISGDSDCIVYSSLAADGRRAILHTWTDELKIWDLESEAEPRTLQVEAYSLSVPTAITSDGRRAVSASDDKGQAKVWDLDSGAMLCALDTPAYQICQIAITADGRLAVSGSRTTTTIKVWDLETGAVLRTLSSQVKKVRRRVGRQNPDKEDVLGNAMEWDSVTTTALSVTPNGRWAICATSDRRLAVWDLESDTVVATFTGDAEITVCAVASDLTVVAGDALGNVSILRLADGATEAFDWGWE